MKTIIMIALAIMLGASAAEAQYLRGQIVTKVDTMNASTDSTYRWFARDSVVTYGPGVGFGSKFNYVFIYNDAASTGRLWVAQESDSAATGVFYLKPGDTYNDIYNNCRYMRFHTDSAKTVIRQVILKIL
ncbi:MAG: hypothetical protein A3K04_08150 [Gallionellales bacterium RBG_16_56_9]|nr:MAG: hypothetical protein A3K04_08150 [Gallionellales bacterium RBG_16_56_9]